MPLCPRATFIALFNLFCVLMPNTSALYVMRQGCGTFTILMQNHTTTNDPLRLCLHPERQKEGARGGRKNRL